MSEDKRPPSPEPFARKSVQWGRMPQATFHAGPLPQPARQPGPPAGFKPLTPPKPPEPGPAQTSAQSRSTVSYTHLTLPTKRIV